MSRGNDNKTVVSKIIFGGVQGDIRLIQQRISAIESIIGDGQSRASESIMGGSNEQANMRSRNNGNDRSVRAVNVKRINAQVTTGGYDIEDPEPGNISLNKIDTNAETCCLGSKLMVLRMKSLIVCTHTTLHVNHSIIVSGTTKVTYSITGNSFIMVINKALYYSKKLDHSLINTNQLRCYGTMVWDNHFDPYRDLCIKTGDGNTIDLTPDGTKIGFISHVPTDKEIRTLQNIYVTSGSEWNSNTMKLGKV